MPGSRRHSESPTRGMSGRAHGAGRARSRTVGHDSRRPGNRAIGRMMLGAPDTTHEKSADAAADAVVGGRRVSERAGPVRGGSQALPERVEREIHAARGRGRPLAGPVRRRLQRSLSVDLSAVRVHTDERAHRISAAIDAEAATAGKDIFFRRGRFRPGSLGGLHTLAHEVTHTLHQRADSSVVQRTNWRWRKGDRDKAFGWREKSADEANPEVLAEVGPGVNDGDSFDDETRLYLPWNPKMYPTNGGYDHAKGRVIHSRDTLEAFEARETKRSAAGKTLKGCKTLASLASKLADAGYNYSTLPKAYIEATDDYKAFKKKKTWYGGDRAKLACRLALRDLSSGETLGEDAADTYMGRARSREESTGKSIGLSGKFEWTAFASVDTTDFGKWALGKRGAPGDHSTMNCWESVIYGAFKAGHVSRAQVRDAYLEALSIGTGKSAPKARSDDGPRLEKARGGGRDPSYMVPIEQLLTRGRPREYKPHDPDGERPLKGDIIAYGTFGGHVAVAEGNTADEPKVVSLYNTPNAVTSIQRVPISSFMGSEGYDHTRTWMYRPFWA